MRSTSSQRKRNQIGNDQQWRNRNQRLYGAPHSQIQILAEAEEVAIEADDIQTSVIITIVGGLPAGLSILIQDISRLCRRTSDLKRPGSRPKLKRNCTTTYTKLILSYKHRRTAYECSFTISHKRICRLRILIKPTINRRVGHGETVQLINKLPTEIGRAHV